MALIPFQEPSGPVSQYFSPVALGSSLSLSSNILLTSLICYHFYSCFFATEPFSKFISYFSSYETTNLVQSAMFKQ